ncbi:MaoC family dehydratase [Halegenticoccus tardaugens]|uniref:MaoC family dehydratase n=1 Tax=Halegenticoccus tardaugens TaxID=2071624 RepID=UPI001E51D549|nr:MaoC family dehydratase [Halegenticoccus tardaugens]
MSSQETKGDAATLGYGFTDAWIRATGHMINSAVEAQRAALAAYGIDRDSASLTGGTDSVSYSKDDWSDRRTDDSPDEIGVGTTVSFSKTLSEDDVAVFADASGDTNRLHLDEAFAEESRFGDRIVHGTLVSGLISAALARLPGLTIYLSQDVEFLRPVYPDQRLTATVEVIEDMGNSRYLLSTDVYDEEDRQIIEGEAIVLIDSLPSPDAE